MSFRTPWGRWDGPGHSEGSLAQTPEHKMQASAAIAAKQNQSFYFDGGLGRAGSARLMHVRDAPSPW